MTIIAELAPLDSNWKDIDDKVERVYIGRSNWNMALFGQNAGLGSRPELCWEGEDKKRKAEKRMAQITVELNVAGIEGLYVITPSVHGDSRGYFYESYNAADMKENGLDISFVQDNQSMSVKGVLRGLHFQKKFPQTKLVRVIRGAVFDVAVDLRKGSQTFGRWHGIELTEENKKQFLIPRGFAHGFLVLSEIAEFCYKCDDFYHPNDEGGLAWNDPKIGVSWPGLQGSYNGSASAEGYSMNGVPLILSEKDQKWFGIEETFKFEA